MGCGSAKSPACSRARRSPGSSAAPPASAPGKVCSLTGPESGCAITCHHGKLLGFAVGFISPGNQCEFKDGVSTRKQIGVEPGGTLGDVEKCLPVRRIRLACVRERQI